MQMHMDFKVPSTEELERHRQRARSSAQRCYTTDLRMRVSRFMSWPTPTATRSVSWSSELERSESPAAAVSLAARGLGGLLDLRPVSGPLGLVLW